MSIRRFFKIQDYDTDNSTGSALFNGSPVYGYCKTFKLSGANLLSKNQKALDNPSVFNEEDNGYLKDNWNRRVPESNYLGVEKSVISVSGGWTAGSVMSAGSLTTTGSLLLTPSRFLRICRSARPIYISDEYLVPELVDGDIGMSNESYYNNGLLDDTAWSAGSAYYSSKGIQSIVKTYNIGPSMEKPNYIAWKMELEEEKDYAV